MSSPIKPRPLIQIIKRLIPWMARLIQEGAHKTCAAPMDAVNGLLEAENAVAWEKKQTSHRARPTFEIFERLLRLLDERSHLETQTELAVWQGQMDEAKAYAWAAIQGEKTPEEEALKFAGFVRDWFAEGNILHADSLTPESETETFQQMAKRVCQ